VAKLRNDGAWVELTEEVAMAAVAPLIPSLSVAVEHTNDSGEKWRRQRHATPRGKNADERTNEKGAQQRLPV
jgi:hypothetical protein